jgi:NADPH:quinone reductase-like Zn-dependent oxidoreductase
MREHMQAILLTAPGSADHFQQATLPVPTPAPDEVRIRIHAAAFNPMDFHRRKAAMPSQLPMILGGEVAGEIDAVGAAVTTWAVGDLVMTYLVRKLGGYAEYVCVQALFVVRRPANLSFAQAAAVPVVGLTAYQAIVTRAAVQPGDAVLITGASGGVGTMAIQIARLQGAERIVVTAGSDQSARYLTEQLGIAPTQIVRYVGRSRADLAAEALRCNQGQFFRIAMDFVGGAMTSLCADVVAVEGHVVAIFSGPRDATHGEPENDEDRLFDKSAIVHFLLLSAHAVYGPPASWEIYAQQLAVLGQWLEDGQLQPPQIRDLGGLSVSTVRTAHQLLEDGHVQGKLVMTLP